MKRWRYLAGVIFSTAALICGVSGSALAAAAYTSPNYQVNEVLFGSGGELDVTSPNYQAKAALGELGVGQSASPHDQTQAGFNTDRTPYIQLLVTSSSVNLGNLTTLSTATSTAAFSVKAYLSDGYVVQTTGTPPNSTSPNHTITALSSASASVVGTEQFGMNLVANTTGCGAPANFGANAVQVPSSSFSYGGVVSGYNTCGLFKYHNGDTIAQSTQSSGETDYTISYIFNISASTPSAHYTFNNVIVATATY